MFNLTGIKSTYSDSHGTWRMLTPPSGAEHLFTHKAGSAFVSERNIATMRENVSPMAVAEFDAAFAAADDLATCEARKAA